MYCILVSTTHQKLRRQRVHKLCANFSMADGTHSSFCHSRKFYQNPSEWKGEITESVLIYNFLESKPFANLDCKVCCCKGKVEKRML